MTQASTARALAAAFTASGLSLKEFAKRAGVSSGSARDWLDGRYAPRLKNLEKAARALGVKVAELVA